MLCILEHQVDLTAARLIDARGEGQTLRAAGRRDNLDQVDDVLVLQLLKDLDLAHGRDREALLVIVHLDHFERVLTVLVLVVLDPCLEHLSESALANHRLVCEDGSFAELELI